eukprot:TRINITY_DN23254_c0_g1_i1.p1 TRINITY_DN23254_c0_g1~~TRINITY_DN23254_c0_g1_i1.p1  ORF type:complete len:329 (+),score=-62.13 TRINITY_DN23254_c0_g1_i1:36-989(+)
MYMNLDVYFILNPMFYQTVLILMYTHNINNGCCDVLLLPISACKQFFVSLVIYNIRQKTRFAIIQVIIILPRNDFQRSQTIRSQTYLSKNLNVYICIYIYIYIQSLYIYIQTLQSYHKIDRQSDRKPFLFQGHFFFKIAILFEQKKVWQNFLSQSFLSCTVLASISQQMLWRLISILKLYHRQCMYTPVVSSWLLMQFVVLLHISLIFIYHYIKILLLQISAIFYCPILLNLWTAVINIGILTKINSNNIRLYQYCVRNYRKVCLHDIILCQSSTKIISSNVRIYQQCILHYGGVLEQYYSLLTDRVHDIDLYIVIV